MACESAKAQDTLVTMRDRFTQCTGTGVPSGFELLVFTQAREPMGYIRLSWWQNGTNVQLMSDQEVIVDVLPETPLNLIGSTLSVADIPANTIIGARGEIRGTVGQEDIVVTLSTQDWDCTRIVFTRSRGRMFDAPEAAELVRRARNIGSVAQLNDGPSEADVKEQMTSAAAYQLCNPTDPQTAAGVAALNATGLGTVRAEGSACVSYMMGFPIGSMRFYQESWSCNINSTTKVGSCVSEMTLRCETPTDATAISANFCSSAMTANFTFTGGADFSLDSNSGRWVAGLIDVVGKER